MDLENVDLLSKMLVFDLNKQVLGITLVKFYNWLVFLFVHSFQICHDSIGFLALEKGYLNIKAMLYDYRFSCLQLKHVISYYCVATQLMRPCVTLGKSTFN